MNSNTEALEMLKLVLLVFILCLVASTFSIVYGIYEIVDNQSCICPVIEPTPTIDPEHHSRPDDNFEAEWLELLTT